MGTVNRVLSATTGMDLKGGVSLKKACKLYLFGHRWNHGNVPIVEFA
jgi:hypothetical protein